MPITRGSSNSIDLASAGGPLPPAPSPAERERGRIQLRSGQVGARGTPPPARHLATSPNAGGGGVAEGSRLGERHLTASAGDPSPDPSPLVPRGEGRIRARFGNFGSTSTSPAVLGRWASNASPEGAQRVAPEQARYAGPTLASPSPAQFAGEGRGGGRSRTQTMWVVEPRSLGHTPPNDRAAALAREPPPVIILLPHSALRTSYRSRPSSSSLVLVSFICLSSRFSASSGPSECRARRSW